MTKPTSQRSESKQSIQWAATPFDKPKTESVILRSTNNIYFNVRKGILAEVSPIFEDMFAQSSPAQDAALSLRYEDETIDGVSVILMHETSFVIDFFLRLYYPPFEVCSPQAIDDAFGILSTARKFLMPQYAQKIAEQQFVAFAEKDPMRVYAVARRSRLPDEMRLAAKASLCKPLVHVRMAELDDITGTDYCNLLRYRAACVTAATTAVRMEPVSFFSSGFKIPWLTMKPWFLGSASKKGDRLTLSEGLSAMAPPEFITFMKAVSESLAVCPVSKVVFDERLWDQLWTSIVVHGQLSVCRRTANEVLSFQKELVDIIDSAISKVVLDID